MPQNPQGFFSSRPSAEDVMARQLREINRKLDLLLKAAGISDDGPKHEKPKQAIVDPISRPKKG